MSKKRSIGHVKKLDNGKYLLRLSLGFDDFGKRMQPSKVVECPSDREAERMLVEFYNERDKLTLQSATNVPKTLGQLYTEWYNNHVSQNLRSKTAEWYSTIWNNHLKQASQIKLDILAPAHIHKIIQCIEGDRTKNAVFKTLKAILSKGVKWGYLASNPCDKIDTPHYEAPEKQALSAEQIKAIAMLIGNEEIKYQAIYYFSVLCSLRRQEIIGLKWSDINFKENSFTIRRAATDLKGKGTVTDKTKTKKSARTLFLPELLKVVLLKLLREQDIQRKKCSDKWIDEDWIFTQWNGEIMCLQTPSHWWREFAGRNGIENITFHGLRHTAATHMIKNNVPISTVSGVLGHAQISTTLNTYTHVIEDTKKAAINVMADMMTSEERSEERNIV